MRTKSKSTALKQQQDEVLGDKCWHLYSQPHCRKFLRGHFETLWGKIPLQYWGWGMSLLCTRGGKLQQRVHPSWVQPSQSPSCLAWVTDWCVCVTQFYSHGKAGFQHSVLKNIWVKTFESARLFFTKPGLLEFGSVNPNVQQRWGLLWEEYQLGFCNQMQSS